MDDLLVRIEKLDRSNRRLRTVMIVLGAALSGVLLLGQAPATSTLDQVQCNQLTVNDPQGTGQVVVGRHRALGFGLHLSTPDSTRTARLVLDEDEDPSCSVFNEGHSAYLFATGRDAWASVSGPGDLDLTGHARLSADRDGGRLFLKNRIGLQRLYDVD